MPTFVRIAGRVCLELDLAADARAAELGKIADSFNLDPDLLLGDMVEFRRNTPLLRSVAGALDAPLAEAQLELELQFLHGRHPHLVGPASPHRTGAAQEGPFECCRSRPHRCLDFPIAVSRDSGTLFPAWDPDPVRWKAAAEGEQKRLSSGAALEAWLRASLSDAIAAWSPQQKIEAFIELGLDPRPLCLPKDQVLYAELPPHHLLFDPIEGPSVGRLGSTNTSRE